MLASQRQSLGPSPYNLGRTPSEEPNDDDVVVAHGQRTAPPVLTVSQNCRRGIPGVLRIRTLTWAGHTLSSAYDTSPGVLRVFCTFAHFTRPVAHRPPHFVFQERATVAYDSRLKGSHAKRFSPPFTSTRPRSAGGAPSLIDAAAVATSAFCSSSTAS